MIALVRGVMRASMSFGSMANDSSISANTGRAPDRTMAS